jgi:hypothetical protein
MLALDQESPAETETRRRRCKGCGDAFRLSAHQIGWFAGRRLSLPKRCDACRHARRTQSVMVTVGARISLAIGHGPRREYLVDRLHQVDGVLTGITVRDEAVDGGPDVTARRRGCERGRSGSGESGAAGVQHRSDQIAHEQRVPEANQNDFQYEECCLRPVDPAGREHGRVVARLR